MTRASTLLDTTAVLWDAFAETLEALVGRARETVLEDEPAVPEGELLRFLSHADLAHRSIRRFVDGDGSGVAELGEDPAAILAALSERSEELARETGARIAMEVRAVLPRSSKDAVVFEQAYLVSVLSAVGALVAERRGGAARLDWEDDLPVGRVSVVGGEVLALIAARRQPGAAGRGLGIVALGDAGIELSMVVPIRLGVGPSLTRAFAVRLTWSQKSPRGSSS